MKKYLIFASIWLLVLTLPTIASSYSNIEFTIKMDSEIGNVYDTKKEMQAIFNEMVDGLDKESYDDIIRDNLDIFEEIEGSTVRLLDNNLTIVIGDGKGTKIQGTLDKQQYCIPTVKPKSFLSDLFSWFK
ncbi:MAG: multidrug transporter [Erysipelotrichaceae bacterium]